MSKHFDPEFNCKFGSLLKLLENLLIFILLILIICISTAKQAVTNEIFKLGWLKIWTDDNSNLYLVNTYVCQSFPTVIEIWKTCEIIRIDFMLKTFACVFIRV